MPVKFDLPFSQVSHITSFICCLLVVAVASYGTRTNGVFVRVNSLLHLACFSGWFGTQVWVTFVAGMCMCIDVLV